ncbi:MAG: ankyrin repeat domain-containing protein [Desulfobacterales bacterium]|nr:ankyrin repeat domain-containing protein [Desulfobacterales bacterium]
MRGTSISVIIVFLVASFLVGCATTPLIEAVRNDNVNSVNALIEKGVNVNEESFGDARGPLDWAVEAGHFDIVRLLVENGAKTQYHGSALHCAAQFGHTDLVRFLIKNGANVNAQDSQGHTSLHLAIWKGHVEIVQMLLNNGASTSIKSISGYTPMYYAQKYGNTYIERMLKKAEEEYYLTIERSGSSVTKEVPIAGPAEQSPAVSDYVPATSIDFGSYHALVVGNNDYRYLPKLSTAINDAQAIASLLQYKYGFKVKLLMNATRADILVAINSYRRTLTIHDNLLIYYAGHGWLDKDADQGYWLPVNATRNNQVEWISNSAITSEIRAIQAKHVMVVADSCYSGKLARGLQISQKIPNYLARISQKKARVVLSSGGLEPVMDSGGKGNHSIFASALIEALSENNDVLDGTSLFTRIREQVGWNADQTPEYANIHKAGHEGGDFLFVRQQNK